MQFNFTELDKYSGTDRELGGTLELVAHGTVEVCALINHFKLFDGDAPEQLIERAQAMQLDTLSHTIGNDKRPAYSVTGVLSLAFAEVYRDWMRDTLGYDGPLPDIDIPRKWGGLAYTHYCEQLSIEDGVIRFTAYDTCEPWNGMRADTYSSKKTGDYIAEYVGTRHHEPEYIMSDKGREIKNPNYMKRHNASPAADCTALKVTLFNWWLANHANDAQIQAYDRNQDLVATSGSYMSGFTFKSYRSSYPSSFHMPTLDPEKRGKDYDSMTFKEFAALAD